jgi:hypothetical protein
VRLEIVAAIAAGVALLLAAIGGSIFANRLDRERTARQALERQLAAVRTVVYEPREVAIDLSPWREELDACRASTVALRDVMETLIRIWPGLGRENLPTPPGGWPRWPTPGAAREWRGEILPFDPPATY